MRPEHRLHALPSLRGPSVADEVAHVARRQLQRAAARRDAELERDECKRMAEVMPRAAPAEVGDVVSSAHFEASATCHRDDLVIHDRASMTSNLNAQGKGE